MPAAHHPLWRSRRERMSGHIHPDARVAGRQLSRNDGLVSVQSQHTRTPSGEPHPFVSNPGWIPRGGPTLTAHASNWHSARRQRQELPLSFGRPEQLYGCERFSRPRAEAVEREPRVVPGLHVHEQLVVFLLGALSLPIKIRRISRRDLDARPTWENRVLFGAATANEIEAWLPAQSPE